MQKIAAAIVCVGFVAINAYLIVNGNPANGWLWLGAIIAFFNV